MARIVVVDDDPAQVALLQDFLLDKGHEVRCSGEGLDALTMMLQWLPDLVVADVMMPDMGGAPLLTAMRENAHLDRVPVILISGLSHEQVEHLCTGHTAFLRKPFSFAELASLIERSLHTRPLY